MTTKTTAEALETELNTWTDMRHDAIMAGDRASVNVANEMIAQVQAELKSLT